MSTYFEDHHLVNLGWIAMHWNMGCAKCPWWDLHGLLASSISLRTHEPLPVDDPPTHLKPLSWIAMRNLAYLNSHQLQSVYEQGLFNDNNTHRIRVWFVHLYLVDFVMVNAGKYTIRGSCGTITPSSGPLPFVPPSTSDYTFISSL